MAAPPLCLPHMESDGAAFGERRRQMTVRDQTAVTQLVSDEF